MQNKYHDFENIFYGDFGYSYHPPASTGFLISRAEVHSRWRPGKTVSGTLMQDGRRVHLTVFPDGSVEERTEAAAGGSRYRVMRETDERGGSLS